MGFFFFLVIMKHVIFLNTRKQLFYFKNLFNTHINNKKIVIRKLTSIVITQVMLLACFYLILTTSFYRSHHRVTYITYTHDILDENVFLSANNIIDV